MALGEVFSSISSGGGNVLWMIILIVVIGGTALILLVGGGALLYFRKKWNLQVEIKLTRADGKVTIGEWGKGFFNSKQGVVYIKRPGWGSKAIPMKTFDVRKYLQGSNLLTVIQAGPDDYRPVLNDSWTEYEDTESGEKGAILNIKVESAKDKAWKTAFEAAAKKAYSLQSILAQFQTPIAIGIVVIACFVGFAIIWTRLGSVC